MVDAQRPRPRTGAGASAGRGSLRVCGRRRETSRLAASFEATLDDRAVWASSFHVVVPPGRARSRPRCVVSLSVVVIVVLVLPRFVFVSARSSPWSPSAALLGASQPASQTAAALGSSSRESRYPPTASRIQDHDRYMRTNDRSGVTERAMTHTRSTAQKNRHERQRRVRLRIVREHA